MPPKPDIRRTPSKHRPPPRRRGQPKTTPQGRPLRPPNRFARRRAACLIGVHVLFLIHILHWKLAGQTLAPLELNEVAYTLELGILTAGFLFMATAVVATAVFGRFFCSWGCHILALEDLAAWVLGRMRIRPRLIRSRALAWIPLLAMFYMFVWPQLLRLLEDRPMPAMHLRTDAEGWASLMTANLWRNLPGPGIALFTFAVCGFLIIYVLGSRSFCRYVCPYGAIFGLADRVAPGRIVARGDCRRCGACTAACQSHVKVHVEAARFGTIVDPRCLRDLDCVSACPDGALAFGLTTPPILRPSTWAGSGGRQYDLSRGEDLAVALIAAAGTLIFRGLYDRIPFLLAITIGALTAYAFVLSIRLITRPQARLGRRYLKLSGRITRSGWAFAAGVVLLAALAVHSAYIRYHEYVGVRRFEEARSRIAQFGSDEAPPVAESALTHLLRCHRFGLYRSTELHARLGALCLWTDRVDDAVRFLEAARADWPADAVLRHQLAAARDRAAGRFADRGALHAALLHAREAVRLDPAVAAYHYNHAVILSALGARAEAQAAYRSTLRLAPDDPDALNNLAFLLAEEGDTSEAIDLLRRAVDARPDFALAHFNLARLFARIGRRQEAALHRRRLAQLDPALVQHLDRLVPDPAPP